MQCKKPCGGNLQYRSKEGNTKLAKIVVNYRACLRGSDVPNGSYNEDQRDVQVC
jgi:hypothetical protein